MDEFRSTNHATMHRAILEYEKSYERSVGAWRDNGTLSCASVEMEVGRLWHSLVLLLQPQLVLETGTYKGYSTACVASALTTLGGPRRLITIDPEPQLDQVWAGTDLENVITFRRQTSQEAHPEFLQSRTRFDMLILDSDHHYDTIMSELVLYEPLLKEGGAILLHDTLYFDGVGAAVRQLLANPRFQGVTFDTPRRSLRGQRCPGVTLVRKERDGYPELFIDDQYLGWNDGDTLLPAFLRILPPPVGARSADPEPPVTEKRSASLGNGLCSKDVVSNRCNAEHHPRSDGPQEVSTQAAGDDLGDPR